MCERGLVHTVTYEGLVDVDGYNFAQRQPGLCCSAVRAFELNDFREPALKRHRTFRHARHIDELTRYCCQTSNRKFVDLMGCPSSEILGQEAC